MDMLAAWLARRSLWGGAILLGHLWLALHPAAVNAEPVVSVSRTGATYWVDVRMDVRGSRSLAWKVLTDHENLQGFVPGMQSSRIVRMIGI